MTSAPDYIQPPGQPPADALPPAYVLEGVTSTWQDWRKTAVLLKHLALVMHAQ